LPTRLAIATLVDSDATLMVLGEGAPGHQSDRRDCWCGAVGLAGRVFSNTTHQHLQSLGQQT
jgi:hypothetical protein